ncbi:MAG: ABC-F family ATP-binding cassette domain-containing protein, partial [Treponema sp.]|nr:ABC-F family ATP-binding cassette domain-containing protein [Treponema sp.]
VNLLILDEPTNHLDMHSKDVLLQALKDFGGTVIFVSHDRGFIEDLSTRVLELTPGAFRIFPGDYRYYMQRLEDEKNGVVGEFNAGTAVPKAADKAQKESSATAEKAVSASKLSWEEQKKAEAERRKAEKAVAAIEAEIEKAEKAKAEAENKMADPEVYSNGEKAKAVQKEINELSEKLEELNLQWMEAEEKLEALS